MQFSDFFGDLPYTRFFQESWGNSSELFTAAIEIPCSEDLFSRILSHKGLRYPQLRILSNSGAISPLVYTLSNRWQLDEAIVREAVEKLAVAPNTIKISDVEQFDDGLRMLKTASEQLFSCEISLNCYFSYGPAKGVSAHYDDYHIFAIQISGQKRWELGPIMVQNPHYQLKNQIVEPESEGIFKTVSAGEILYLPPGLWHEAETTDSSVHLTLGVRMPRCFQLIQEKVSAAARIHHELRDDRPFHVDNQGIQLLPFTAEEVEAILLMLKAQILRESR